MKKNIKKFVIIILIVIFLCLAVLAYVWFLPMLHDKTLEKFSEQFLSIIPPQGTQVVDTLSIIGHQSGNSNHCDYLVATLLKTKLPKSDIETYYINEYKGSSRINFFWLDNAQGKDIFTVNPTGIYTLNEWVNVKSNETQANVIIYIFEGAMTSALDLRCR